MLGGAYQCQLLGALDMKKLRIAGMLNSGLWRHLSRFIVFLTLIASCEERYPHNQQRGCRDDALIHAKLQDCSSFIVVKGNV
jgi:hypothetical protein